MYAHIFRSAVLVNFQRGGPDEGGHSAWWETSKGNERLESRGCGGYFLSSLERRAFENERQTQVADLWRLFEVCFPARSSPRDVKSQRRARQRASRPPPCGGTRCPERAEAPGRALEPPKTFFRSQPSGTAFRAGSPPTALRVTLRRRFFLVKQPTAFRRPFVTRVFGAGRASRCSAKCFVLRLCCFFSGASGSAVEGMGKGRVSKATSVRVVSFWRFEPGAALCVSVGRSLGSAKRAPRTLETRLVFRRSSLFSPILDTLRAIR